MHALEPEIEASGIAVAKTMLHRARMLPSWKVFIVCVWKESGMWCDLQRQQQFISLYLYSPGRQNRSHVMNKHWRFSFGVFLFTWGELSIVTFIGRDQHFVNSGLRESMGLIGWKGPKSVLRCLIREQYRVGEQKPSIYPWKAVTPFDAFLPKMGLNRLSW